MDEYTVTASEFQKNFGRYKEMAQRGPVCITSSGRPSVVVISVEDYREFKEKSRYAYGGKVTEEFQRDLDHIMEKHAGVLAGLAKR